MLKRVCFTMVITLYSKTACGIVKRVFSLVHRNLSKVRSSMGRLLIKRFTKASADSNFVQHVKASRFHFLYSYSIPRIFWKKIHLSSSLTSSQHTISKTTYVIILFQQQPTKYSLLNIVQTIIQCIYSIKSISKKTLIS